MTQSPDPKQLDKIIRTLRITRIFGTCVLAAMGPLLLFMDVVNDDNVVWVCMAFAALAVIDWTLMGRMIRTMEKAREQS